MSAPFCGTSCTDQVTPDQAFRKLIALSNDGCPALRVKTVDPADAVCDPFITCDNMNEQEWRALFFQMIDSSDPDCWKLNVVDAT